ncbi:MAG TPA: hypothetical protein VF861_13960, partial [Telluria sp.]
MLSNAHLSEAKSNKIQEGKDHYYGLLIMASQHRLLIKSYAMARMGMAIERAITARTSKEKTRAARWAAAWGLLCGINTKQLVLRNDAVA